MKKGIPSVKKYDIPGGFIVVPQPSSSQRGVPKREKEMTDYLKLADEALADYNRQINGLASIDPKYVPLLVSALRELHEKCEELEEENELLAGDSVGIEKRLGAEVARLKSELERLQRVVNLTESFFGAVAQGYPDWENEKRAELVVEAIAALSPGEAKAQPTEEE